MKKRGKLPTQDNKASFLSDGNDQYTTALLENLDVNTINYGQLIKMRENGRVVSKTKRIIFGVLDEEDIVYGRRNYGTSMDMERIFNV